MDLDLGSLRMPDRLGVNYDEHINRPTEQHEAREVRMGKRDDQVQQREAPKQAPV